MGGRKEKEVRGKGGQPRWEERQASPSSWQEASQPGPHPHPKLLHLEKLARSPRALWQSPEVGASEPEGGALCA